VILVEGGASLLSGFPEVLRQKAKARLEHLGVEVRLGSRVTGIDGEGVHVEAPARPEVDASGAAAGGLAGLAGVGGLIAARTVLWGAGVRASPLAKSLGVPLDRAGRVEVSTTLHPPGHDEVFVCGDIAAMPWVKRSGEPAKELATTVPGVAQGGIQSGRYAAKAIRRRLAGKPVQPFAYFDKGTLATIGRASAVAQLGRWKFSGFFAWLLWVFIHIMYLASFRNRIIVLIQWTWAFITWNRPSRIILERPARWPPADGPPPPAAKP
jgi:NADH dehydrogenase